MAQQRQPLWFARWKLLVFAGLIAALIIVTRGFNPSEILERSCGWIENFGGFAPLVFIVVYNLGTLLFLPGSLLTLKGGILFGLFWGSLYVIIAAILGATIAFLLGRYFFRDRVSRIIQAHPKFRLINAAIADNGWQIVLLTRLSPIFPFNLTNYAFGLTQISLRDYVLGSLGILPGTIMYTYLGTLVGELSMAENPEHFTDPNMKALHWGIRIMGLAATIGITIYLAQVSRNALEQKAELNEPEEKLE